MAQSPSTHQDGDVLEGLLCPYCYQDLKTISQLQDHVHLAHPADDQDVFQTLKGFLGKAKKKIMKKDAEFEDSGKYQPEDSSVFEQYFHVSEFLAADQETGVSRNHTRNFKKVRDDRIGGYVIETNKLLIRLDRLISEAPDDPEKRKSHEKNVVPWIPDGDVRLCPGCAKTFGLPRRRHHCRLCGGVMCQTCSKFIDFTFAKKLMEPTSLDSHPTSHSAPPTPIQRKGSNTSLMSIMSVVGEPHIRICRDCHVLLVRRNRQMEEHSHKPIVIQKYERMREYMHEVDKLAPVYQKIVDSLCAGEATYHLTDAKELKLKLSRMADGVDQLSKVIAKLPATDESVGKNMQLQNKIRMAMTQYLRDTILGLPPLPTEEEVTRYRKRREDVLQKRLQQERVAEQLRTKHENSPVSSNPGKINHLERSANRNLETTTAVAVEAGWSASPNRVALQEENPMLLQMNLIRQYIKQARQDHKYDEVQILERNLLELQLAYSDNQAGSNT